MLGPTHVTPRFFLHIFKSKTSSLHNLKKTTIIKSALLLASQVCNCNINDNVWREDSGTLREAPHYLPIIEVRVVDITPGEDMAKITVGPLVCYEGNYNKTRVQ